MEKGFSHSFWTLRVSHNAFGLCNAPVTFQHFINDIFRDFLDLFVIVYLEDILIFSPAPDCHQTHIRKVLARLRLHGFFAKGEKCEFGVDCIQFLGLVVSTAGIEMDPQKVSAIREWPVPQDKGVQRFIRFFNFYRRLRTFQGSSLRSPDSQRRTPLFIGHLQHNPH